MNGIRITLVGEASICVREREIALPQALLTLIAFLLLQPRRSASRDKIASALWPSSSDAAARNALSSALYRARVALPAIEDVVIASGERFSLADAAARAVDFTHYSRWLDRMSLAPQAMPATLRRRAGRILAGLRGRFLEGVDAEWAALACERWRCRRLDALVMLAELAAREGDWSAAVTYGREVCAEEPLREDAQRLLIDVLARSGNRGLALAQFKACRRILREELGVAPMAQTRTLADRIRSEGGMPAAEPTSPAMDALLATRDQLRWALENIDRALLDT